MGRPKTTLVDVLVDIRTERALRYCCLYASCLSVYFFWNYSVRISPGIDVVTPSQLYWAMVLVSKAVFAKHAHASILSCSISEAGGAVMD